MTAVAAAPAGSPAPAPPAGRAPSRRLVTVVAASTILGALLLGFLVDISVIGGLRHSREQQLAYDHFRVALANSTAPTGQTDFEGKLLSLGTPVALLEIPQIGLRETVLEGTTSRVLMGGPGHERDTPLPGQAGVSIVMGRRSAYGHPFQAIGDLQSGQLITVTTGQGVAHYRVVDVRHHGDPIPALPSSGGRLILMTADGSSYAPSDVLRVDADLVGNAAQTPTPSFGYSSLPANEKPLAGDTGVLVTLVLWAQALLVVALVAAWGSARWGLQRTWLLAAPVLLAVSLAVWDSAAALLPNLL